MNLFRKFFVFLFTIFVVFFGFSFVNKSDGVLFASIDKIVFINKVQTVSVGVSSKQYQIQLQDSSGAEVEAPFTVYFTLPLELGTFSSQKDGNAFTTSSSIFTATGSSNKYFYYKSNITGSHLIKVIATNKDKTLSWEAEQIVNVVADNSNIDNSESDNNNATTTVATSTATSTDTDITNNSTSTTTVSVHYITEYLSEYVEPETVFKVSAGRERLAYVGLPVSFEAKYKVSSDLKNKKPTCLWTFGDGSTGDEEKVIHTYKYPGEYNVVLNSELQNNNSVSRTKVKVLVPDLSLSVKKDGSVEVSNKGANEINLYGLKISSQDQTFSFPIDTIISAGKSVIFPAEYLKFAGISNEVKLSDETGRIIAQSGFGQMFSTGTSDDISVADFERFALEYKKLTQTYNTPPAPTFTAVTNLVYNNQANKITTAPASQWNNDSNYTGKINTNIPVTATALNALITATSADEQVEDDAILSPILDEEGRGFWGKIFHPVETIQKAFYQ